MGRKQRVFPKEPVQGPQTGLCYQAKVVWLPCPPHRISPLWEQDPYLRAEPMSFKHQEGPPQSMPHPRPRTEAMPSPHFRPPLITLQPPCPTPRMVAKPLPHLQHQPRVNHLPSHPKHHVVTSVFPLSRPDVPSSKPAVTLTFSKQCPPLYSRPQPVIPLDLNPQAEASSGSKHFPKIFPDCGHLAEDVSHYRERAPYPSFVEAPPREVPRAMYIAVPQTGPGQSVRVATIPVSSGHQIGPLPKPKRRIRATNALLGFLKLEPMLHPTNSATSCPHPWPRDPASKSSGTEYWAQPKRRSSSHPDLLCPWKTVSLLYCNDNLPKSLGVPLSHSHQKTGATTASNPEKLPQAGDATCPVVHGLFQMGKKPWETIPVRVPMPERTTQDQRARQIPFGLHLQDKTLHVPDHQVIFPLHPKDPSHPIAQVSLQMEQEHRKAVPPRMDHQATNPAGQDHWAIPPFLGTDGQKTILFVPRYRATPPPSPNHQAEDVPGPVAYTLKTTAPKIQPQATTRTGTGQNLGTALSVGSYRQDIHLLGIKPQATMTFPSDCQTGKIINPNAQMKSKTNPEPWETMAEGTDQKNINPFVWGYGANLTPQSTDNKATAVPSFNHWVALPPFSGLQTKTIIDPNVQFSLQPEQKHHEARQPGIHQQPTALTGQNQRTTTNPLGIDEKKTTVSGSSHWATMVKAPPRPEQQPAVASAGPAAQVFLRLERELMEPMPPRKEIQTPTLTEQDLTLVSSLGLNTQDSSLLISKHQGIPLTNPAHQPEDTLGDPKAKVSQQEEFKQYETTPEGINQQTINPTNQGQGATLPLSTDVQEISFRGPDHWTTSPPNPDHQAETIPVSYKQDSGQLKLEYSEMIKPATEQQTKNPTGNVHGATLPLLLTDEQATALYRPSHQVMSHLGPNLYIEDIQDSSENHLIQPEEPHCQMAQSGTNQQITNSTGQDQREITLTLGTGNQETILLDSRHQAIPPLGPDFRAIDTAESGTGAPCKTEQENKERTQLGREHRVTAIPGHNFGATRPPLGSDLQDKTLLAPGNHASLLQNSDQNVHAPGPVTNILMQTEQVLQEAMPVRTDQQITNRTAYDHQEIPPLPGSDHQVKCSPNPSLPKAHISIQKEQVQGETLPKKISHPASVPSEPEFLVTPTLDSRNEMASNPGYRTTLPHCFDGQAKDTIEPIVPTWVPKEQEPRKTTSMTIDQQAINVTDLRQGEVAPPLDLEPQDTTHSRTEHQATPLYIPDHLDEKKANKREAAPQEIDQQAMDQGFRTSPPRLTDPQDKNLPPSDHQIIPPASPLEASSESDPQNMTPSDYKCVAKRSGSPDHQVTHTQHPDSQVTSPASSAHQAEARLNSTKSQDPKIRTVQSSGSGLKNKSPRGQGPQAEDKPNSDPEDHNQSESQHQTQPAQNKKSFKCLKYLKPYIVEGGQVSDAKVQDIISSIPQEKIKNDVYKQILLRKKRKFSPHSSSRYSSSYYPVCLICASWIPDGCPHEGMKYPSEAQLMVIPIPMPGSEELGVKFILQVPHKTPCPYSDFPYSDYSLERYPHDSPTFTVSSYSEPELPRPSRPKWLHFILDKPQRPERRNQEPVFREEMPLKRCGLREEETREDRTFFKSLLDRFQWRLGD